MNHQPEYLTQEDFFSTFDLGLTCALFCLGYELTAIEKADGGSKSSFLFRRDKNIEQNIGNYWNGRLTLDARSYFDAIRCVKNRLYSSEYATHR